ncbi:MAG: hypothetical protein K6T81_02040 [Alicyclobacillus macrosporangiidus]|uniref:MvdC/MvdD family ATP grasp protein n=1 Tax=Alicyclobacillus macrosporangiidus TaxID=392015 RepID=UPI0026F2A8BE|nr:hypothetical protein [Alicyclobacillus macrosporangiidus]MCL6597503.1 hypothetical protein [Alicyclobacillus macrosporangiidus]
MILIYTNSEDLTADYFILYLEQQHIPFFRFNTDQYPSLMDITYLINSGEVNGYFRSPVGEVELSQITSVWYRKPVYQRYIYENSSLNQYITMEIESSLEGVVRSLPANFVSHPKFIYHAEHKLVQLQKAINIGFRVPDTILTSVYDDGYAFLEKHEHSIIKPVRRGRIIEGNTITMLYTTRISQTEFKQHRDSLNVGPAYMQKQISKQYDLRVTVFGNTCFCVAIHSQQHEETQLDWRRRQDVLKQTVFQLPKYVSQKCIELVKSLNLKFGAIDLILDTNGEYYFLEINPTGQWAWMEQSLDLPMREALYRTLEGHNENLISMGNL